MSNTVTNNDETSNDPNDIYNSWGYDTDEYEDMDDDFMDPIDMQVSDTAGVPGNQVSVELNSPEDFRKALQDLENKVDASDLSKAAKEKLLDKVEDAERLVEYTYAEDDKAADKTFKDIAKTMSEVSDTMEAAPAAADLDKKLDDLSKKVAKGDFPKGDKNQSKWKEEIGKMQSKLALDPSEANQKAAQDLIDDITKGLKDSAEAAKKETEAAAKVPEDMMKKLELMSESKLNQSFILDRLHDSYPQFDTDNDGKISMAEFGKAIEDKSFPPKTPTTELLHFIYAINPDLQDNLNAWAQGAHWDDDNNFLACGDGKYATDAEAEVMQSLKILYPDVGIGPDPSETQSAFIFGDQYIDILNLSNYEYQDGDTVTQTGNDYVSILEWSPNHKVE